MSHKSQSASMKALAALLSVDLSYIYGEKECGPNGAKKDFLSKGRAFMAALGKDLHFREHRVTVNKGGIAVSGEVYLTGLWTVDTGLYLWLEQDLLGRHAICYRTIRERPGQKGRRKQYEHEGNHCIPLSMLATGDYDALLDALLEQVEDNHGRKAA